MSITAVSRCLQCHAVVNVHWLSCLVCQSPLPPVSEPHEEGAFDAASGPQSALTPPLQPGWIVTYTDPQGRLCGGADDREHGTVKECRWQGSGWIVVLTDGHALPLSTVRAVGSTDAEGRLTAAWTVRGCGYDGTGQETTKKRREGD